MIPQSPSLEEPIAKLKKREASIVGGATGGIGTREVVFAVALGD
jgi:hypothetical protein